MSAKQDRAAARTAEDLKRQYDFDKSFSEIMGVAKEARTFAEKANETASKPADSLTSDEVFNLLTENGTSQGVYRGDDGQIYINASYIKSGELLADLIKSGILQSADGAIQLNLNTGSLSVKSTSGNLLFIVQKNNADSGAEIRLFSNDQKNSLTFSVADDMASIHFMSNGVGDGGMSYIPELGYSSIQIGIVQADDVVTKRIGMPNGSRMNISWSPNGDGTYTLVGTPEG